MDPVGPTGGLGVINGKGVSVGLYPVDPVYELYGLVAPLGFALAIVKHKTTK